MDNSRKFDFIEYMTFILMMLLSCLIGLYFGCIKQKEQNTVSGYLLGGKKMSVFPIVMSLVSSMISGITLLGVPTEVYVFGTQFLMTIIPAYIATFINIIAILPVFYNLQLISLFEYMEMRFNKRIRQIISFMYIIGWIIFIPTVIYGPGLALNQVSGMNVHIVTPIVSVVCILYTTLGGLRAVVWSDTLQGVVMIGSVMVVVFLGIQDVGGMGQIFNDGIEGERLEFFNMDPNPNTRITFWSSTFGLFFMMLVNFSCNPAIVQRFISLPTIAEARKSSIGLVVGSTAFLCVSGFTGLIIYSKYKDCNPLQSKMISRPDQILPLFVIEISKNVRGLSGLFMAGIVCAALSSMSTGLNTLSGVIYEDFIEPRLPSKPDEKKASLIMKFLVVVLGIITVSLVALVEKLGQIVEVAQGFAGMTAGTIQGIFILGLFFPNANSTGAFSGGLVSLIIMTWLMTGNVIANANNLIKHPKKPMSEALCPNITETITLQQNLITSSSSIVDYFPLYKLSVFNYSLIGGIIVLLIGIPVSQLTGGNKHQTINSNLISPIVNRFMKNKRKGNYDSVQLKIVNPIKN